MQIGQATIRSNDVLFVHRASGLAMLLREVFLLLLSSHTNMIQTHNHHPPLRPSGMMDPAYFTSRKNILDWINSLLKLQLTKIEQTATGAVACQLCDYMYPGSINLSRVDWAANTTPGFVNNYKLLQQAFNKHNVSRFVDVDKLIREKYQDNLEFMQWFKAFFDQCCPEFANEGAKANYDPEAIRAKGKGGKDAKKAMQRKAVGGTKLLPTDRVVQGESQEGESSQPDAPVTMKPQRAPVVPPQQKKEGKEVSREVLKDTTQVKRSTSANSAVRSVGGGGGNDAKLTKEHDALKNVNASLRTTVEGLEKERDFYFDKLRDIEIMLQTFQEGPSTKDLCSPESEVGDFLGDLFKVMYATTEDGISVDDDGKVVTNIKNSAAAIVAHDENRVGAAEMA
jgi:RP/EB family microtubule-associated protein